MRHSHVGAAASILALAVLNSTLVAHDSKILVFSKTAGFRHASIPDGIQCLEEIGADHYTMDATEDSSAFTDENLAQYAAVVFLSTTGDVLNDVQQGAFERYVQSGGGYVGIHAASDTEYDWPWYGRLVGAYFKSHPRIQDATILVEDPCHPSTTPLPERWQRKDEWYNFRGNPRSAVHVLAALDTTSYDGSSMDGDHPIAWCHAFDGGRAWYTGGGHTKESFSEPLFREHLLGGIRWAAGARRPTHVLQADRTSGAVPLGVTFAVAAAPGVSGHERPITFAWDFDGDGTDDATLDWTEHGPPPDVDHVYREPGAYAARLTVRGNGGPPVVSFVTVTAGNHAPEVAFVWPPDGGVAAFGRDVLYKLETMDREDGLLDGDAVVVRSSLGHDDHVHPVGRTQGIAGTIATPHDHEHGAAADVCTVVTARVTDAGATSAPPLTSEATVTLRPSRMQVEHATRTHGVRLEDTRDPEGGGRSVASIDDGDWTSYAPLNLHGVERLRFRVASGASGGTIEVRAGAPDGPLAAKATVPETGGWWSWVEVESDVRDPGGTHEYFLVFRGGKSGPLFDVNWVDLMGPGVTSR